MRTRMLGILTAVFLSMAMSVAARAQTAALEPARMPRAGSVDERFQSYNVEMVEVTGGRFWAPYRAGAESGGAAANPSVTGIDPNAFRQRPPIDLSNARLRKLAAALGPAYVRVSGTWANSTYFHNEAGAPPSAPPAGFGGVLTQDEWRGVLAFAKATDARIVTSFAISEGTRDANGVWQPDEARKFLSFTKAAGGSIAAAEFFNEPNAAAMGGAPKGYDAAGYARDFAVFRDFVKEAAPSMMLVGPGSVGEGGAIGDGGAFARMATIPSSEMLKASASSLDAVSYHFYGGVSRRCAVMGPGMQTTPEAALTAAWLSRTERERSYYAKLRDEYAPGKPLWLTETGETACGGNPWAASFLDTFRYLNQLGWLAKQGVQVVMHNTLAASDYALIDEETFEPRPSYWGALLWRRLMSSTVLDAGASPAEDLRLYAHCLKGLQGGVALLAINTSKDAELSITLSQSAERYTLTSPDLLSARADLNGKELKLGAGDRLPAMTGQKTKAGEVALAPRSITFLAIEGAGNRACRAE